ncbi:hypothetical protein [Streptomyces sp. NPDC093109]|uniref:hypothetical protein n=1 Tax=Streptomyces sp. NPDC093109 TaxID=3154977 RepID=UPI00344F3462
MTTNDVPDDVPGDVPSAPGVPSRARRLLGTVVPAVLVVGAVAGGLVFIKTTVDGADRDVTAAVREKSDPKPGKDPAGPVGKGRTDTELTRKLLPVPSDYRLGPDIEGMSNDGELTAEQLKRMFVTRAAGNGVLDRDRLEDLFSGIGVSGRAMRSYSADRGSLTVEVNVSTHTKAGAARDWHEAFAVAARQADMREGPSFGKEFKAACFRQPRASDDIVPGLRSMMCTGYVDDVVVSMMAEGKTDDLDAGEVAKLMRRQLDHLESPGRYV